MEDDARCVALCPMNARVVLMTRAPVPGQVKTRLIPALGADGACALHQAMAIQTIERILQSGLSFGVALTGPMDHPFVHWLHQKDIEVEPQVEGDLGARLRHALRRDGPQIALGSDCPVFDPMDLRAAAQAPEPVSIGPTTDGGYWLIKIDGAEARDTVFYDIPWSTDQVTQTTLQRAEAAQLPVHWLPTRYDVDEPTDLDRLRTDPEWAHGPIGQILP
jgi:rSAM/selenodomain-associated transferase 1